MKVEQLQRVSRVSRARLLQEQKAQIDAWLHEVEYDLLHAARIGKLYIYLKIPENLKFLSKPEIVRLLEERGWVVYHNFMLDIFVGWEPEFWEMSIDNLG
jgi:hypothetical protein